MDVSLEWSKSFFRRKSCRIEHVIVQIGTQLDGKYCFRVRALQGNQKALDVNIDDVADIQANSVVDSDLERSSIACYAIRILTMCRSDRILDNIIGTHGPRKLNEVVLYSTRSCDVLELYRCIASKSFGKQRYNQLAPRLVPASYAVENLLSGKAAKLQVVVSPVSGIGNAERVWEEYAKPILDQSRLEYSLLVTESQGHATRKIAEMGIEAIEQFSAIVVFGGDGTVFEVLQGLRGYLDCHRERLSGLALGVVPCGSGNGLSASLHVFAGEPIGDVHSSILSILQGHQVPMDIWNVQYLNRNEVTGKLEKETRLAFLSLAWAFVADVDIESEKMRWLGWARFYIGSAIRVIGLRKYYARLSFTTSDRDADLNLVIDDPVPSTWQTMEGTFVWFWAVNCSHGAADMHVAPGARIDSGFIHLSIIRDCSRLQLIPALLAVESGKHRDHTICLEYKVKGFRLEMFDESGNVSQGMISLDGEQVNCSVIQATCSKGNQLRSIALHGDRYQ